MGTTDTDSTTTGTLEPTPTPTLVVHNPATGAVIAELPAITPADVPAMVDRARAAQRDWAALGASARARLLRDLRRWLYAHEDEFVSTISAEGGKPREDAFFLEWVYAMSALAYWAKEGPRLIADRRSRAKSRLFPGNSVVERHVPHGVVGVIGPWNYPFVNSVGDAIPALVAGNAVILKPASKTPMTSLLMERGMREVGFPAGVFQTAVGPGAVGAALVDHVDMIMFTGSTGTGRRIGVRAAERMIPFSLELGGKDPMVVLADADVDRAATHALYYGIVNGGQTCMSIERVYVEAPIYDEFVQRLVDKARSLRTGDPTPGLGSVENGAMTVREQVDIVDAHVRDAVDKGARLLVGGRRIDTPEGGHFFEPTVLADADHSMDIMVEETFGPTVQIQKVADVEEAIRLANDSSYALAGSVYSGSVARAEEVARRLETGTVAINDALVFWAELQLPLGGWKESGAGQGRHGAVGILKYTKTQGIFISRAPIKKMPQMFPYGKSSKALHAAVKGLFRA